MRYKLFGNTGLRVSELALGTLTFGNESGFGAERDESRRVFDAYAEAGGNFLDTANKYNAGTSERYVGEFVAGERDRFVIATKYSLSMRDGDPNAGGNHRKCMVRSLEDSLRRLDTDYVDLFWLHQWDFTTPVEEVVRGLDDLVRSGKVLYVGISDAPAWIVSQANTLAYLRGWSPFAGMQIEYSLIERTPERELLPMARSFGLGLTLWGVVGGGVLSGKYHAAADPSAPPDARRAAVNGPRIAGRGLEIAAAVQAVADGRGCTATQVALAWARQQDQQCIPIVGNRTEEQVRQNIASLEQTLDAEELERLDAVSRIDLGFPHEFLMRERIVEQRFGGTQGLLDSHRVLPHR